jgi:LacI family transcriptional regulator, gluconate utilization system Gnt-I transcriptional repressor
MQRPSVTMKDLAKAAEVSVMTVSRAFNADKSVNAETRDKILAIAESLGYVFDATAANLRTQKSGFVALTIPSINNANFAATVDAMSERLAQAGLQVLLGYSGYALDREEELIVQLLRRRPEAIVLTGGHHSPRARRLLENAGIPVIETWELPADPIGHVVGFSNARTMHGMVDHLVALGHKRICFVGGEETGDQRGMDRRRGFIEAMTSHALSPEHLFAAGPAPVSMREGALAMAALLDSFPQAEAVVCVSDLIAFGALSECQRRGIRVPEDIAIGGFGAYEIASVAHPTITTIDPQPREIGYRTAALIIDLLDPAQDVPPRQRVEIDWQLLAAGSTSRRG